MLRQHFVNNKTDNISTKDICMRLYSYVVSSGYVSSEERNKNNLEQEAIIQDIPLIDASKGNANSDKRKGEALILDPGSEEELVILPSNVSAKDIVLRRCQQTYYLPFEKCYPNT